jgi:flagellin-specific chaperone FliS
MYDKNPLNAYRDMNSQYLTDTDFEKKWYESVIMRLQLIQNAQFNPVEVHIKLIEVADGLSWIQENLNERLSSEHRAILKRIYSNNIDIINGAIATKNMSYLDIVIDSLKTVMEPYYKKELSAMENTQSA